MLNIFYYSSHSRSYLCTRLIFVKRCLTSTSHPIYVTVSNFLIPILTHPVPIMVSYSSSPSHGIFLIQSLLWHLSHPFLITSFSPTPYYIFLIQFPLPSHSWIEGWLKKWRQSVCVDNGRLEEYLRCQDTVHRLRQTPCNNKRKSIMEALKTDLECGSTAGASLVAPSPLLALLLVGVPLFLMGTP